MANHQQQRVETLDGLQFVEEPSQESGGQSFSENSKRVVKSQFCCQEKLKVCKNLKVCQGIKGLKKLKSLKSLPDHFKLSLYPERNCRGTFLLFFESQSAK